MPTLNTKHFGEIDYQDDAVIQFPSGLPGFENQDAFVILERPGAAPLVFLQSVSRADLRLPAVPMNVVDPVYRLAVTEDDLAALGLPIDRQPEIGNEILCLAVVATPTQGPATFNLLAPIIVNVKTRQALQAIRLDSAYSHEYRLEPAPICS